MPFCQCVKRSIATKKPPQNNEASPVLPPAATPALTSLKVVTVEVPQIAPIVVAIASESIPSFMLSGSPFSSRRLIQLSLLLWNALLKYKKPCGIFTLAGLFLF